MYREAIVVIALLTVTISLTIYGALGPSVTLSEGFTWDECDTPVNQLGHPFVTKDSCTHKGRHYDPDSTSPPPERGRHVYYVTLPVKMSHRIFNRWHQFLLVDFDITFKHKYLLELQKSNERLFAYEVALGYRDSHTTEWSFLTAGNSSRLFDCKPNHVGILTCEFFPLFELWSIYYEHYIINLRFMWLPVLGQYRDNSIISEMSLHVIHQHPVFTLRWFILKSIFTLLSITTFIYSFTNRHKSLYHKSLLILNASLLLFNFPLEWLSLLMDTPWMTLCNDIRQGLLILVLMLFWTILIKHNDIMESGGSLRSVCGPFLLASLTAAGFLVYEISERGIQVLFPFYSLWGSTYGQGLVYIAVGVASGCGLLYLLSLIISFVQVRRKINSKLNEANPSSNKSQLLKALYGHLLLTLLVAICSILGYVLPSELFLLQSFHGYTNLSLYGALLMGNYGLWNSYIAAVTILSSTATTSSGYKVLSGSIN